MRLKHFPVVFACVLASGTAAFGQSTSPSDLTAELVSPANAEVNGNALFLNQWVRLTADGSVVGNVSTLSADGPVSVPKVRVSLIQGGKEVAYDHSDVGGDFLIEHVLPGNYSLVASAPGLTSVFYVHVLDSVNGNGVPDRVQVRALSPTTPRIEELLRAPSSPKASWVVNSQIGARSFSNSENIKIDARGGVSGKLTRGGVEADMSRTTVYLFQDGREVSRVQAGNRGQYRFESVQPGRYGFVASGPDGVAAFAFAAVDEKSAMVTSNGKFFVSTTTASSSSLNVELAEPNALGGNELAQENPVPTEPGFAPMVGPGFAGGAGPLYGGGGGGGAGFGGRGLAGLAAIGGLIGVAVAEATKKNDTIVSPVGP